MPKLSSLTSFMFNLWPLLSCILIHFLCEYLIFLIMLASQFFAEIADLFSSSFKVSLSTLLIYFSDYLVLVCRSCILFNTWVAAPLRFTSLFFLVRIVACDSLICLSYHSQAPIYFNILNIVIFWLSDSPTFSTRIHMELSD